MQVVGLKAVLMLLATLPHDSLLAITTPINNRRL